MSGVLLAITHFQYDAVICDHPVVWRLQPTSHVGAGCNIGRRAKKPNIYITRALNRYLRSSEVQ
jgi:hypothetical protein